MQEEQRRRAQEEWEKEKKEQEEMIEQMEEFAKRAAEPPPSIAISLVEESTPELYAAAGRVITKEPDIIEWRVDSLKDVEGDIRGVIAILPHLKKIIGEVPLYFTCRSFKEGGYSQKGWPEELRLKLIKEAAASGVVAAIDTEITNKKEYLLEVRKVCRQNGVKFIASHHDFFGTPPTSAIINFLVAGELLFNADMSKLAVMPQNEDDVARFMQAAGMAKKYLSIPYIAISMGKMGGISRILGGLFGSEITFAKYGKETAPGLLDIDELRHAMRLIYKCD